MKMYITAFIASIVISGGHYLTKVYPKRPVQTQTSLMNIWKKEFQEKYKIALQDIQKAFDISDQEMAKLAQTLQELQAKDPAFNKGILTKQSQWSHPDHPLTQLVVTLLKEHNLCADAIEITIDDTATAGPAAAFQRYNETTDEVTNVIVLNNAAMEVLAPETREAILRHEIQHIIHYDSLEEGFLRCILKTLGYTAQDWETHPSMVQFRHLKELRADQLSAVQSGGTTIAAMRLDLSSRSFQEESICHPAPAQRIAGLALVEEAFKKEITVA